MFIVGWMVLLLLLLLLGESFIGLFLLGLGTIWLVGFRLVRAKYRPPTTTNDVNLPIIGGLWLGFFLFFLLSSIATHSLPLSLMAWAFWGFAFLVFWFVVDHRQLIGPQTWVNTTLLVTVVLVAVSVIFNFFPHLAELLPGTNLLYATFGHNHLGAFLLLVMPLGWWWTAEQMKRSPSLWWLLLPSLMVFGIATSFGRVVLAIALLQLLTIAYLHRRSWLARQSLWWHRWLLVILILVGVVFSLQLFSSIAPQLLPKSVCQMPLFDDRLCKPITGEQRPIYWWKAMQIISHNPWLGTGPGTFFISARKYQFSPEAITAFAHNAFLQMTADIGLIGGGLFAGLMIFSLIAAVKKIPAKLGLTWQMGMGLGLVGIYLNALFDFDWDFIGIVIVLNLFLATLISSSTQSPARQVTVWQKIMRRIINIFWYILATGIISFATISLIAAVMIQRGNVSAAFSFFPYYYWQRQIFEPSPLLSPSQQQQLMKIYQNHPDMVLSLMNSNLSAMDKQLLKESLVQLEPWRISNVELVGYYVSQENWDQVAEKIVLTKQIWEKIDYRGVTFRNQSLLSDHMVRLAEELYRTGQPIEAAHWYLESRWINPWKIQNVPPIFQQVALPPDQQARFFREIFTVPTEFLGKMNDVYTAAYLQAVLDADERPTDEILADVHTLLKIAPWSRWQIWDSLGASLLTQVDTAVAVSNVELAQDRANGAYQLYEILHNAGGQLAWSLQAKLARLLVEVGNLQASRNISLTVANYDRARTLHPIVLQQTKQWFENALGTVVIDEAMSSSQVQLYLEKVSGRSGIELGWKTQQHLALIKLLVQRMFDRQEFDQLQSLTKNIDMSEVFTYTEQVELVKKWQRRTDDLVTVQRWEQAQALTAAMQQMLPDEYWLAVQPGNLAVLQGDLALGKTYFERCLADQSARSNSTHRGCEQGLLGITTGDPHTTSYWNISQIIQADTTGEN